MHITEIATYIRQWMQRETMYPSPGEVAELCFHSAYPLHHVYSCVRVHDRASHRTNSEQQVLLTQVDLLYHQVTPDTSDHKAIAAVFELLITYVKAGDEGDLAVAFDAFESKGLGDNVWVQILISIRAILGYYDDMDARIERACAMLIERRGIVFPSEGPPMEEYIDNGDDFGEPEEDGDDDDDDDWDDGLITDNWCSWRPNRAVHYIASNGSPLCGSTTHLGNVVWYPEYSDERRCQICERLLIRYHRNYQEYADEQG